jgi:hypothetical protein
MDRVSRTEPVIDVDDGDPWGAGVEHSKKGGDSFEVSTVTHGCRYGDEGGTDESAQYAGEGGFHSCDHNQGVVVAEGVEMLKGPMEACNTDVIESGGAMSKKFQRDVSFFCNGVVGCSCGADRDMEGRVGRLGSAGGCEREGSGGWVVLPFRKKAPKLSGFRRVDPSGEDRLACRTEAADDG